MQKPGRWALTPSQVHPEYQPLWRNMTWCVPLWEGGGKAIAYPYGTNSIANTTDGEWRATQYGMGHTLNETGTLDTMEWPIDNRHGLVSNESTTGDVAFSVFVYYTYLGYNGGNPALISRRDSFAAGTWGIIYASIGVSEKTDFVFHNGTGNQYSDFGANSWPGQGATGGTYGMLITRHIGGEWNLYVDGEHIASDTGPGTPSTTGKESHKLQIGELVDNETGNHVRADYHVAYIWQDRALELEDAQALARDPFGPIRPAFPAIVLATDQNFIGWGIPAGIG